jgi:pantoate--beta-alanine ligase
MPPVVTSIAALRAALAPLRADGIGFVPTMGALHDGHLSLVNQARRHARHVVVSIFVNPAQFAPGEDFDAYPRTLDADRGKLAATEAALIFAPSPREMYPDGFATTVSVKGPARGLESDFRPHFFDGVATVVAKLLIAVDPDQAVFGEKDYQQLLVVRRMATDLNLRTQIHAAPTLRESDGLAMSSRNAYLSPEERRIAGQMNVILKDAAARRHSAMPQDIESDAASALRAAGFDSVDYVALRDAATLGPVTDAPARILAAAKIGRTRLIDNFPA